MKRILLFITTLFFSITSAQSSSAAVQEQWFIQIGVFSNIENALNFQLGAQQKINESYASERTFGHFASIHSRETHYRVLLGPYPTKTDAQATHQELAELFPNVIVAKFITDTYSNYQYGYKFIWHEIDKKSYQKLHENSLATLNFDDFISPSFGNKVSLITHTDQIKEEIFDLGKTKQLLSAKNIIFLQDDPNDYIINGFVINGKEALIEWSPVFYAYYPTEDLIVFSVMDGYISFDMQAGEWGKGIMPYNTLYLPDRTFRITGNNFAEFGYGRNYIESYDKKTGRYIELIDLGIISPWFNAAGIHGLAWQSNNEVIFILEEIVSFKESFKTHTRYYRVTIDSIYTPGRHRQ